MRGVIDHFSYSQLNTYLMCPLRYRLQYVELIPPAFTTSALVFGSAVHEAVAAFHHQRLLGDTLGPDQMLDVYRQAWTNRNGDEIRFCNGDNEEALQEKASQVLTVYHESFDPSVEILGIEEFFEMSINDTVPPFQGYIDLIEQGSGGNVTVVDLKTAARKLSNGQADSNLQLTAYSVGAQSLGFNPDQLTLRLDVVTKTKNPELMRYETTRTEQERERFCKLVTSVWHAIERETWFPRHDWQCAQCAWSEPCSKW
ncbi:RecB family exonuclease [Thermodesulfobacteriota bacterium]